MAGRTDPATSHAAARAMLSKPSKLAKLQLHALRMVREHPGSTAQELATLDGTWDPRPIGRRLSELQRAGLIRADGEKPDPRTGRQCQRWWTT